MERNTKKSIWLKSLATKLYGPQDWEYRSSGSNLVPCRVFEKDNLYLSMYADFGGFGSKPKCRRLKFPCTNKSRAEKLASVLIALFQEKHIEAQVQVYETKQPGYAVSVNELQDYPWNY